MPPKRPMRPRQGLPGLPGPIPKHHWEGTELSFQNPDSKMAAGVDLKGPKGDPGKDGKDGADGKDGRDGRDGKNGKSAYQLAVDNGFDGDLADWLLSIRGRDGDRGQRGFKGSKGDNGNKGDDGRSAYEVWLQEGHTGTEADFFDWLADKIASKIKAPSRGAGPLRLRLNSLIDVDADDPSNGDIISFLNGKWIAVPSGGANPTIAGNFLYGTVVNRTVWLITSAVYASIINSLNGLRTSTGTCTLAFNINGTPVTGLAAIAVTSTPQDVPASGLNNIAIGDELTMVITDNAAATDLRFTMDATKV